MVPLPFFIHGGYRNPTTKPESYHLRKRAVLEKHNLIHSPTSARSVYSQERERESATNHCKASSFWILIQNIFSFRLLFLCICEKLISDGRCLPNKIRPGGTDIAFPRHVVEAWVTKCRAFWAKYLNLLSSYRLPWPKRTYHVRVSTDYCFRSTHLFVSNEEEKKGKVKIKIKIKKNLSNTEEKELSFSLCDDGSCVKNKTEEQIPLQVKLPQDSEKNDILLINKDTSEKAEEEISEKQDNMCSKCKHNIHILAIISFREAAQIFQPIIDTFPPHLVQKSAANVRAMPSPKLRSYRSHKQEQKNPLKERLQIRMHASDNRHQLEDNGPNCNEDFIQSHKHPSNRDHVPECRDRRNHYLDLAGVESPKRNNLSQLNHPSESPHISQDLDENHHRIDAKYVCPYRLLDRSHTCSKPHRTRECPGSSPFKKSSNYYQKLNANNESGSPHLYRTKVNRDPQDDLLNLDYDLNDLVPEAKFDWEKPHHRRSKSYDLYESNVMNPGGFYSPKLKPKKQSELGSDIRKPKLSNHLPSSPGHHYRHRHRDKERQRAMQEVANWIAREHSSPKVSETAKHFVRNSIVPNSPYKQLVERHEHHHLHEHVHHHYHHIVEF
ncbi:protein naked cuticle homolog [Caerostris extrusa]|uniref:Protein naked cuticle homolog n=1 Tax=Caerostris extrusa TaxID=172846 RepID=A0AAV4P1Q8_CAEEX|nr:protein naked cuticle homolog [Caerostris extrusa]